MPMLDVTTNLDKEKFDEAWMKEATDLIAKLLGKPNLYVMVNVVAGHQMSMGGSSEPCAIVHLSSIGQISEEKNKVNYNPIADLLVKVGVPKNRMYVQFTDLQRNMVGWNGKLFSQ
eukprot:gene14240-15725_t